MHKSFRSSSIAVVTAAALVGTSCTNTNSASPPELPKSTVGKQSAYLLTADYIVGIPDGPLKTAKFTHGNDATSTAAVLEVTGDAKALVGAKFTATNPTGTTDEAENVKQRNHPDGTATRTGAYYMDNFASKEANKGSCVLTVELTTGDEYRFAVKEGESALTCWQL